MAVIDSTALLSALAVVRPPTALTQRLAAVRELHAPELLDVELLQSLRRLVATGELSDERAQQVREDVAALRVRRYPHGPLVDRAWELRDRSTPSDAMYVVLAEVIELPLVTCDQYLANASGHGARVELFA